MYAKVVNILLMSSYVKLMRYSSYYTSIIYYNNYDIGLQELNENVRPRLRDERNKTYIEIY